jgi:hypothetical protein
MLSATLLAAMRPAAGAYSCGVLADEFDCGRRFGGTAA